MYCTQLLEYKWHPNSRVDGKMAIPSEVDKGISPSFSDRNINDPFKKEMFLPERPFFLSFKSISKIPRSHLSFQDGNTTTGHQGFCICCETNLVSFCFPLSQHQDFLYSFSNKKYCFWLFLDVYLLPFMWLLRF